MRKCNTVVLTGGATQAMTTAGAKMEMTRDMEAVLLHSVHLGRHSPRVFLYHHHRTLRRHCIHMTRRTTPVAVLEEEEEEAAGRICRSCDHTHIRYIPRQDLRHSKQSQTMTSSRSRLCICRPPHAPASR